MYIFGNYPIQGYKSDEAGKREEVHHHITCTRSSLISYTTPHVYKHIQVHKSKTENWVMQSIGRKSKQTKAMLQSSFTIDL